MQSKSLNGELQILSKTIVQDLKKLQNHKDWQKYGQKPCLMQKMEAGEGMATRSTAVVNFPINQIVEFLNGEGNLKKLNPTCIEDKKLVDQENLKVTYLRYSAPWPVSHRDFVSVAYCFQESPNKYYLGSKACKYPCPQVKGVVRGEIIIGGYIIEYIDQKSTKVTYITRVDIKGSIPGMVKNQLSKKQGEVSSKIQAVMREQKK